MHTYSKNYKKLRKFGLALCKKYPKARVIRQHYWNCRAKEYQKLSKNAHTNEKSIVFEAFGGRKYTCSPKALYLAMCQDPFFDDWTFYWSFKGKRIKKMKKNSELRRANVVMKGSSKYYDALAESKYWIQNNRIAEYITPRADQIYVQCWHGTPLKRLGFDVSDSTEGGALNSPQELAERFKIDSDKWTYLLSPSGYTSKHLCDAFGVEESRRKDIILEEGYPRNDSILHVANAANRDIRIAYLKGKLGIPLDKKVLLFAPTWRDDQYQEGVGYTFDLPIDFTQLQSVLGGEWVILLRMHYYIANKLDLSQWAGFVYNVSRINEINELYCVSDAICTDYSSVFFDYANTHRPLIFYWPDRKHYENDLHGFYLDIDSLPGPKCETTEEVASALLDIDFWQEKYGAAYDKFIQTFCPLDDGHASERVIRRIVSEFKN